MEKESQSAIRVHSHAMDGRIRVVPGGLAIPNLAMESTWTVSGSLASLALDGKRQAAVHYQVGNGLNTATQVQRSRSSSKETGRGLEDATSGPQVEERTQPAAASPSETFSPSFFFSSFFSAAGAARI